MLMPATPPISLFHSLLGERKLNEESTNISSLVDDSDNARLSTASRQLYWLTAASAPTTGASEQPAHSDTVAFIDARVPDYLKLAQSFDASIEVVILAAETNGVQQIADALASREGIEAVHIFSHGSDGSLQLGSSELDSSTLPAYETLLARVGSALGSDADLLLYGCDVVSGQDGEALIEQLALLTGADVAASDDPTGASARGGDADLEIKLGDVSTTALVSQATWDSLDLTLRGPAKKDADDQLSEARPLGAMSVDRAFSAAIDNSSDVDMFSFAVTAGQRIAFDIDRPSGTLDSYLRLFDAAGTELASNDNAPATNELLPTADSWLEYTFATGGTYYVGVSSSANFAYSATAGTGDKAGTTGAYYLYANPTGGPGVTGISGSVLGPTGTVNISIERADAFGEAISPTDRTWIVIHGRNSSPDSDNIKAVCGAIDQQLPADQVLTIDWSAAAREGFFDTAFSHEDWIPYVADWAADALIAHGFLGSTLNLVGHSWGSYVAAELAEEVPGGVNGLVALDPAENGTGAWDPNAPGEINFDRDSEFSWAFFSRDGAVFFVTPGDEETPTTADEAFVVTDSDHGSIVFLFAHMEDPDTSADSVSQLFQLDRLLDHTPGPWVPNQFDYDANLVPGGYEAVITTIDGQYPQSIYYVPAPVVQASTEMSIDTTSANSSESDVLTVSDVLVGYGTTDSNAADFGLMEGSGSTTASRSSAETDFVPIVTLQSVTVPLPNDLAAQAI
jgi:pimeloyl-ACP methyl ester carboxylesterase